ncbi:MAG TPA: hypothetical protein VHA11_06645 [Bryobacteraceae bacterium]|nr:hypothetical protein [Bryobacteraceae bacterium]
MKRRLPPWAVLVCLAVLCAAVIGGVAYLRAGRVTQASLLSRLPADNALILAVDFRALRRDGVLGLFSASRMMQEPEYRAFVDGTGFDYLNDLDSALVSFHPSGTYLLLRGRFDWKNLREYVLQKGGTCYNTLCKVGGSTPQRHISFYPLQPGVMALAVSEDDAAATKMQLRGQANKFSIPDDPVWALIPVSGLKDSSSAPPGTRAFARALGAAESVLFAAGPDAGQMTLRMDAACRTPAAARALAAELRETTARLRELITREHQTPNAADLSGVLAAGAFEPSDTHVLGRWPLGRDFLENLAGGSL